MKAMSLLGFLAGTWWVQRRLTDGRTGQDGTFTGTAAFTASAGGLDATEAGVLTWGTHRGPARRAHRFASTGPWSAAVSFDDGRPFHEVDLGSGNGTAAHSCGADLYTAEYRIVDDDHWQLRWHVNGPNKTLELATTYARLWAAGAEQSSPGAAPAWAAALAHAHLAASLPTRWAHVQAVGAKAERLHGALGSDADLLAAAAWLHDLGYAPELNDTDFHAIDGARHLAGLGLPARLCALVAHHSGGANEAALRGLADAQAEFVDERTPARDALWFCDMTTGPHGQPMTFDERLNEIRTRYAPDSLVPRAVTTSAPEIRAAIDRTEIRARESGIDLA